MELEFLHLFVRSALANIVSNLHYKDSQIVQDLLLLCEQPEKLISL